MSLINSPIVSIKAISEILIDVLKRVVKFVATNIILIGGITILGIIFGFADGPHVPYRKTTIDLSIFALYWIGLGIASSIGLGTGLHTFVLYLGPHIA